MQNAAEYLWAQHRLGQDHPAFLLVFMIDSFLVRLWDLDGRRIAELPHSEPVRTLAVSRDGKRILTGSEDGRALLWDVQGNELFQFPTGDAVQQVAFSTDGENVVTVSPRRVRIWNFGSPWSIIERYQESVGKLPTESHEQPVHQAPQ